MMRILPTVMIALMALAAPRLVSAQATYPDAANPGVQIPSMVQKCLNAAGQAVPVSSGQCQNGIQTNLSNPTVLTAPQSYSPAAAQPVGLDTQGGVIPATGLRVAPVSCTSACTTTGFGLTGGVAFYVSTWPYTSIGVDITSVGGGVTFNFEASNDNPANCPASTNWFAITGNVTNSTGFNRSNTATGAGINQFDVTGVACFRVRASTYVSGTITVGAYLTTAVPATKSATINGVGSNSTPSGAANSVVTSSNPYPAGSSAITAVGTGTTGAVSATLAASSTLHTYICGADISAIGGTATIGPITVTNLMGSTFTYQFASSASGNTLALRFSPCVPTSGTNTSIVITTTADGTASGVDVNAWGYQL